MTLKMKNVLVHLDVAASLKVRQIIESIDGIETQEDAILWAIHNVRIVPVRKPKEPPMRFKKANPFVEIELPPGSTNMARPKRGVYFKDNADEMVQVRASELRRLQSIVERYKKANPATKKSLGRYR